MTSIFSGQLYRGFVKDQNQARLERFNVNRFQKTIEEMSDRTRLAKEAQDAIEYHQAFMGDLQTKLSEITEKLNNVYRKHMNDQVAFLKPQQKYAPTSQLDAVAGLPRIDTNAPGGQLNTGGTYANTAGYPAGSAGLLPYDDFDKIRNFPYNPYFGSKAIDQSDKNAIRTFWENPGQIAEDTYRENGAFWSSLSYLWGWDLDRINATYATGDLLENGREDVQINITALQPNKQQYPPLKPGDRFPINWTAGGNAQQAYPAVNITGVRPGGVDFSHASDTINTGGESTPTYFTATINTGNGTNGNPIQVNDATGFVIGDTVSVIKNATPPPIVVTITGIDTSGTPHLIYTDSPAGSNNSSGTISKLTGSSGSAAHLNTTGKDAVNMGWEFDDLPISLQVVKVETRPDGSTVPTEYKVVYDIPPTHPFYNELRVLNGTEPQILDAPEKFQKERIQNSGFNYTGFVYIPGTGSAEFRHVSPFIRSGGAVTTETVHNPGETEYPPPRLFNMEKIGEITVTSCNPVSINTNTMVSMKYRYAVHQHPYEVTSPGDESLPNPPATLTYTGHDWNSSGANVNGHSSTNYAVAQPGGGLPFTVMSNANLGAAAATSIGRAGVNNSINFDAYNLPPSGFAYQEEMFAKIVQGPTPNQATIEFYFKGDINFADIEIEDLQIVSYNSDGSPSTWTQGLYGSDNAGQNANPLIGIGDMNAATGGSVGPNANPTGDDADVINKYYPGVFQFTQFNDQYNLSHTTTDRNDILRSPWEFAMLNIDETADPNNTSGLSGEMYIDINGRRINLDHDKLQGQIEGWGNNIVNVANPNPGGDYVGIAAVQAATDFDIDNANPLLNHPVDDCNTTGGGDHATRFMDADPMSYVGTANPSTGYNQATETSRTDTLIDEVLQGENPVLPPATGVVAPPDPGRTSNTVTYTQPADYYNYTDLGPQTSSNPITFTGPATNFNNPSQFLGAAGSTDYSGTVDRIHASDGSIGYKLTIPTSDVNVLKNENNMLFNFGSIPGRDWSIRIKDPYMDVRTITGYKTEARYRVDAGGNIYDLFGKGFYDNTIATDNASINRLYTKDAGAKNAQISNADHDLGDYAVAYAAGAISFEEYIKAHDRLSMGLTGGATGNDDFNLFDYTPDLNKNPASKEGATFGEQYVGSLPTNFYYYRELLDKSGKDPTAAGAAPTGDIAGPTNFNGDKKPAINIDGRKSNVSGAYTNPHTSIFNAENPSFTNVSLGIVEQRAELFNTDRTTSYAIWQDFPGLNTPVLYARSYSNVTGVVDNPISAIGNSANSFASMRPTNSSITLDMGSPVNSAGYLILNEMGANGAEPHAIPLPLISQAPTFPNFDPASQAPISYTFDAYGAGSVTRTGSKYLNFNNSILDPADGTRDNSYGAANNIADNMSLLNSVGGVFASGEGLPNTWPNGVLLHVDDASKFEMENPKNTVTLGNDPTRYRIMYRNTSTSPDSIFLIRNDGAAIGNTLTGAAATPNFIHSDLQVRELSGSYTVSVVDNLGALSSTGSKVKVDYFDNGTNRDGKLVSVGLSSEQDRVGRLPGDDPRTQGTVETNRIGPELFDSPKGYVQPDAQVDLHLVSQDKDGNQIPRKLTKIKVELATGEQILPSALQQIYTTFDESGASILGQPLGNGFNINGGAAGNWPIAIYDGDQQINPAVTNDLNYFVGYYQGINAIIPANPLLKATGITVVDGSDFQVGHKITINGEQRTIASKTGANTLNFDEPLNNRPKVGDRANMGDNSGQGTQDLKLFLNRNLAMSMGAGLKITMEYENYEYRGYPPTVFKPNPPVITTDKIGFADKAPKNILQIAPGNTGDGLATGIQIVGTVGPPDYIIGDNINVDGASFKIRGLPGGNSILLGDPVNNTPVKYVNIHPVTNTDIPLTIGTISHVDHEDFLVVGKGRSGGSSDNEFTKELKRIVDDPKYAALFKHDLFKNIFVTASVNDPFNDIISTKLFLNWDRRRKELDINQASFNAYFKSI